MKFRIIALILGCMLLGIASFQVAAQEPESCPLVALNAVQEASIQCANVALDSACYGNPEVIGSFLEESSSGAFSKIIAQDFFLETGDQADLLLTEAIQTGPLDLLADPATWGLSYMNVQASLPNEIVDSTNNKGVIYLMLGGIEVEDDIEPEEAISLLDSGIQISTAATADMRISPVVWDSANYSNAVRRIPAETTLNADAVTPDGEWVRIVFEGRPGWISTATLDPAADLSDLVEIGEEDFTPMQSFFFRTGIRHGNPSPSCALTPSILLVQGPDDIPVHLRVHRADIRIESTVVLRTVSPGDDLGDFVEIIPLFGLVTIFPDTPNEILVPPGFVAQLALGEFVSLGIEDDVDEKVFLGVAGPIRPLTQAEIDELAILEELRGNPLHYPFQLPTIIRASGVGGVIDQIFFENPEAVELARRACEDGRLSEEVCEILGF